MPRSVMITGQQIYRPLLILFGLVLTLFGLWDLLVPRARFVKSDPPASAVVSDVPSFVTVSFSNKLASDSHIDVTSTIKLQPSGDSEYLDGRSVVIRSEIDPGDPTGKSLRATLRPGLHKGLYWISWTTKVAPWRTISYGKAAFGVGMNVPHDVTREMGGVTWERNYEYRSRRAALIGGVIMLVLALFLRRML